MLCAVCGINREFPIEIGQESGGRVRIVSRKEIVRTVMRKEGGTMADGSQKNIGGDAGDRENNEGKDTGPKSHLLLDGGNGR
jgi:hypothetical protein